MAVPRPWFVLPFVLCACLIGITGCHSAMVDATVHNAGTTPARLIEVDYPSASFGVQALAPGKTMHYRFKILGSGPLKLTWTDPSNHEHTAPGPTLHEGEEGTLAITLTGDAASWSPSLHAR